MKLVLAAVGLLVSLATVGIACGPKEKYCYAEGMTCSAYAAMKANEERQSDADDGGEAGRICIDQVTGKVIDCPN